MTTPAVNIEASILAPGYFIDRLNGEVVASGTTSNRQLKYRSKHRPESSSNRANPITGWRDPSGWYHYGYNCNPAPVGQLFIDLGSGYIKELGDTAGWDNETDGPTPNIPDSLRDRVIGKALSKLKDQKVNLALAVLERAETAELVVNQIHRIIDLTRAFKKRDPKLFFRRQLGLNERGHRGRKIPEAYLEWKYGVEPLMTDVHGACEALREKDNTKPPVITIKASSKLTETSSWIKPTSYTGAAGFVVEQSTQYQCKLRLDYYLDNPLLATLSSVGITNPLELAWERLPFSFVADWFIPVGNWLGYLDASLGYQFKSGTISEISRRTSRGSFRFFGPAGFVRNVTYSGNPYQYNGWNFHRTVLSGTPLPSIGFKNPFPKNGIHIANAAALLGAAFR